MIDQHFWSVTATPVFSAGVFGALQGGERVIWRGRAGVAEYAFDKRASLPRWTLPESTELMVTDRRVMYAHTASDSPDDVEVTSGELRWLWPQHLRVQPGVRETGRSAAATQIQLVCGGSDGSWPALVFAGGDLKSVADADRLANLLRQSIARFRVDNAGKLGLTTAQSRLLSRLLIGPEFSNYQGGPGQTVSLQGALPVSRPAAATPVSPDPASAYPALAFPAPAYPAPVSPGPAYPPLASPVAAAMAAPTPAPVSPAPMHSRAPAPSPAHRAPEPADAEPLTPIAAPSAPAHASLSPGDSPRLPADSPRPTTDSPRLPADSPRPTADSPRRPAGSSAPPGDSSPPSAGSPRPPVGEGATRVASVRPGMAGDVARALQAANAEAATQEAEPHLASRAADLAARVANLVSRSTTLDEAALTEAAPASEPIAQPAPTPPVDLEPAARFDEVSTTNLAERAAILRRSAARFAANSASSRVGNRRTDRDPGITRDLGAPRIHRNT
jgi:hypothetical protein